jgi:TPR repeat protein
VFGQENIAALKQKAASGNAAAQCGLGRMYEFGWGVPQGFTQAAIWLRKVAEQGSALAQMDLGALYAVGRGVPQDYAEAYFWFKINLPFAFFARRSFAGPGAMERILRRNLPR